MKILVETEPTQNPIETAQAIENILEDELGVEVKAQVIPDNVSTFPNKVVGECPNCGGKRYANGCEDHTAHCEPVPALA